MLQGGSLKDWSCYPFQGQVECEQTSSKKDGQKQRDTDDMIKVCDDTLPHYHCSPHFSSLPPLSRWGSFNFHGDLTTKDDSFRRVASIFDIGLINQSETYFTFRLVNINYGVSEGNICLYNV